MSFNRRTRAFLGCLIVLHGGCAQHSALQTSSRNGSPVSADVREVRGQKTEIDSRPADLEARLSCRWSESMDLARKHFLLGDNNRAMCELDIAEAIKTNSATRELRVQIYNDQAQREAIRRGTFELEEGYYDEAIRFFEVANSVLPTKETERFLRHAKCRAFVQSAMTQIVRGDRSRATELLGEALWYHECSDARQLLNEISQPAASKPVQ